MSDPTNLPPSSVFETLDGYAPEYCRAVLSYFRDRPTDVATVDDLATAICDRGRRDQDERRVAIRLHHATLPKLAEAGVVEYDARSTTVCCRSVEGMALPDEAGEEGEWSS